MKKYITLVVFVALFIILYPLNTAHADSKLPAYLDKETHLTKEGSPYIASDEGINVTNDSKLIIDAGVEIQFPLYTNIYVEKSELIINGSEGSPVILKGQNSVDWGGLYLKSSSSTINSLRVENAYDPIDSQLGTTTIYGLYLDGDKNIKDQTYQYGVHSTKDSLVISSSTIINFKTVGIYQESGSSRLDWNQINNNGVGMQYKTYSSPVFIKKENLFRKLLGYLRPRQVIADSTLTPMFASQNTISGNTMNAKNLTTEVNLDLRNNYWGSVSGPVNTLSGNILFSPWLETPPIPVQENTCCSSILFIPGFEATRLNKGSNQLWEPNRNADVDKLGLNTTGQSIDPSITVGDVINKTNIGLGILDKSIYSEFFEYLDRLVDNKKINEWQSYPYDWRLDLPLDTDITNKLKLMAANSISGKITLIGHSNGGLVAEKIVKELKDIGREDLIDKVILVATPEIGAPSSVGALLHGDDQSLGGGFLLSQSTAREFGKNLIGAYNLLPSTSFFSPQLNSQVSLVSFSTTTDLSSNLRLVYGDIISTYQTLKSFLLGTQDNRQQPNKSEVKLPSVLNPFLLDKSYGNHEWLDDWNDSSSIKMYQIGAYGMPTTIGIEYKTKKSCLLTVGPICTPNYQLQHDNKKTTEGDGTVPIVSSLYHNTNSYAFDLGSYNQTEKKNFSHADLLEVPDIQNIVGQLLQGSTQVNGVYVTFVEYGYDKSLVKNTSQIIRYGVHSPVTITAFDGNENKTGRRETNNITDIAILDTDIPGTTYEEIGEDKYLYTTDPTPIQIQMIGTGNGTFSFDVTETNTNGDTNILQEFKDLPVMEGSKVTTKVSDDSGEVSQLEIDIDGDNIVDVVVQPNTKLSVEQELRLFEKSLKNLSLPKIMRERAKKVIARLVKLHKKGIDDKVIEKIHNFYLAIESRKIKSKNTSQEQIIVLVNILSSTLTSLESEIGG